MGFRAEKTVRGAVLQPYIKKESGRSTWLKAAPGAKWGSRQSGAKNVD